jgi:hypothetical protein
MKIRNIYLAIKDQMPLRRFIRNLLKGNLLGLIHKRSHFRHEGQAKVAYGSKKTAEKAAKKMKEKQGVYFSNYKCFYCDGYHLGKNWESRKEAESKTLENGNSK